MNKKDRLILLVGASGSGKTTIAQELEKMRYNIIISYTTRLEREKLEWGQTFLYNWSEVYVTGEFIGIEEGSVFFEKDKDMMAYKEIYGEHYFATKEQYQGKGTSIYVVDPDGARQVQENVKDAEVVTIFLMAEEDIRFVRLMYRHNIKMSLDNTKEELKILKKIKDRRIKDRDIFKTCKTDYVVDANREIEEVLKDVVEIINE